MSCVEYFDSDTPVIKNELIMSDLNLYNNEYMCLKEEEKNEDKSLSDESNFQNFIKREFIKEMTSKNIMSDNEDDDLDDTRRYEITNFRPLTTNNIINHNNYKQSSDIFSNFNYSNYLNEYENQNENKFVHNKRIFNIIKVPKNKKIFQCLQRKREYGERSKKFMFDWDNIKVPKEKHFHFDRKKHRIVFQRRHLKVIYSIVDLTYPFDFNKCFDMIKSHIGDKTVQNYGTGKSFHIIKINNEEQIVTLKDKKKLLRENKLKNKELDISNLTTKENTNKNKTLLFQEIRKK